MSLITSPVHAIQRLRFVRIALAVCVVFVGAIDMSSPAFAKQLPRDVIRFACPSEVPGIAPAHVKSLCQEMLQRLAEAGNDRIVRPVPKSDVRPTRTNEIGVLLELEKNDAGNSTIQLLWLNEKQGEFVAGPAIEFGTEAIQSGREKMTALTHHVINNTTGLRELLAI